MEMKIRESCLQTGTFIYKPGISVTKQDFHLQMGSLGLQMGFSGYYLPFDALHTFVSAIKNCFELKYDIESEEFYRSIKVFLPVEPSNNLFDKMTTKQMDTLYKEICTMEEKLNSVLTKTKKSEACEILVQLFGEDFPITVDKSVVGTSESA